MADERQYRICVRCVMDTSDPEITFDEEGICSHCKRFENSLKQRWFPNEEGKKRLDRIIKKIVEAGKGHEYDCIIGLSGGVDSSYLAYMLRTEYPKLRILAVHIDAGWNSELAVHNIENIIKKLDIDLYTAVIDWEEMKDLQLAYLKSSLANQDVPQDHAFFATLHKVADTYKIRYFLSGGNWATESILPFAWGYNAKDAKQLKAIHRKFGTQPLNSYTTVGFFKQYIYYPYITKFKTIRPLDYWPYIKEEAKVLIQQELDWRDYGGKHHESVFTKFFQAYYLPTKFGYDKRRAHLSSLIVSEQITREAALKELEEALYDSQMLEADKEFVAKKLGLNVDEFDEILRLPNKDFKDYPSNHTLLQIVKKTVAFLKKFKTS